MRVILLLSFSFLASPAFAILGSGDTSISQSYPCVGLDGVPITAGDMEAQCCSNGRLRSNPPPICRAGFNTISGDAMLGVAFNMDVATTTLDVVDNLEGTTSDFNLVTPEDRRNGGGSVNVVTAGMRSSGDLSGGSNNAGKGGADADSEGMRNGSGRGGFGSGSGSGGGGAGSGSGSGLFGSLSGTSGNGSGANGAGGIDPNANTNKPLGGGFASNGQGKDGSSAGRDGFGVGMGGGDGSDPTGHGLDEIGFGSDEALTDGGEGEVEGTANDPENYFSLTHKSDDLFKIVTRRYHKKYNKLAGSPQDGRVPAGKIQNNKPL